MKSPTDVVFRSLDETANWQRIWWNEKFKRNFSGSSRPVFGGCKMAVKLCKGNGGKIVIEVMF